jgi:hypothetical protein
MLMTLMAIASAAAAQSPKSATVSSREPETIVQFLQEEGYKAKLEKDSVGDPIIKSANGGSNFSIMFYGCEANQKCNDTQFVTGYDTDDNKGPSLEKINEWNASQRFAQANLDKNKDPEIRMDVLFTQGVLSREAFLEHLDSWLGAMGRFEKHIGW